MSYQKCEWRGCTRLSEITCFCNPPRGLSFCNFCFVKHKRTVTTCNAGVLALIQPQDLPYEIANPTNEVLPMDVFLQRLRLRFKYLDKMLQRGLTVEQLLLMDMKDIHCLCRTLGMTDTEKYTIWDELFYIRAVTGSIRVVSDYFAQLAHELTNPNETTLNAHLVPRRGYENNLLGAVKAEAVKKEEPVKKYAFEEEEGNEELFKAIWEDANH